MNVDVDRTLAGEVGLTQRDIANSLLVTLSGSAQVQPNFWLNPKNGVSYPIVAQMPQYRIDTMSDLGQRAGDVCRHQGASVSRRPRFRSRRDQAQASFLITMCSRSSTSTARCRDATSARSPTTSTGIFKRDAKGRAARLLRRVDAVKCAPWLAHIRQLYFGLAGAIVLIYLVIVVNFQSWLDPFIIITALPGRARRHRLDAVHHRHDAVGPGADRRHHVHGHRDRE